MNVLKISYADESHIPALKEIWRECFGDSDEYIDFFFKNRFKSCKTVIALYDGKTIGAAYLMPVKAYEYGTLKNGWYGYAIGILKKYRKKGIYAMMHEKIIEDIKDGFYILCPANQKLCEYYASLGFKEFSFLKTIRIENKGTNCEFESKEIPAQKYVQIRNGYFNNDGLILWDDDAIDYAMKENKFCGGFTVEITSKAASYAVIARPFENFLMITESTVPKEYLKDVTAYLCEKYGFEYAVWTRASYDIAEGEAFLSGMSCNLKKPEFAYLNLVLN